MSVSGESKFITCDTTSQFTGVETILKMILEELMKQNAVDGMEIIGAGETYEDSDFYGVVVREDTVIGMLRIDIDDVRDDYGIVGKTLPVTDPAIMAPKDNPFSSITVTSGSVWVLKKL